MSTQSETPRATDREIYRYTWLSKISRIELYRTAHEVCKENNIPFPFDKMTPKAKILCWLAFEQWKPKAS